MKPRSVVLGALVCISSGLAQDGRSAAEQEVGRLWEKTNALMKAGEWKRALEPAQQMLVEEVALLGDLHWDVAGTHHTLAQVFWHIGEYDAARDYLEIALEIGAALERPTYELARIEVELADVDRIEAAAPEARERLFASEALQPAIRRHFDAKRADDGIPLVMEQLAAREHVLGPGHPQVAEACSDLGLLHRQRMELLESRDFHLRALEIREATVGVDDPQFAQSLHNVAQMWTFTGQHVQAIPLARRSAELLRELAGEESPGYAIALESLQRTLEFAERPVEAEAVARRLLEVQRRSHGDAHEDTAGALNLVGKSLLLQGRRDEAEELLLESVEILRAGPPAWRPRLAGPLANLGTLYLVRGDPVRAEECMREAAENVRSHRGGDDTGLLNTLAMQAMALGDIERAIVLERRALQLAEQSFGRGSYLWGAMQTNLASLLAMVGQWEDAAEHVERARTVLEAEGMAHGRMSVVALDTQAALFLRAGDLDQAQASAERAVRYAREIGEAVHPRLVGPFVTLARIALARDELDEALRWMEESLRRMEAAVGTEHPAFGGVLAGLADIETRSGRRAAAFEHTRRALRLSRRNLELAAGVQSERQQLSLARQTRGVLAAYLDLAAQQGAPVQEVYAEVLAWKGAIYLRQKRVQRERRRAAPSEDVRELQELTDRFASMALATPPEENFDVWREEVEALRVAREEAERELTLEGSRGLSMEAASVEPEELRAALAEDAALVDYVVHGPRLTAFVSRPDGRLEAISLGGIAEIEAELVAWRRALATGAEEERERASAVHAQLWAPLGKALEGAGHVFVSPDGGLARLPFAALPSADAKGFLIEDVALSMLSTPRQLLAPASAVAASETRRGSLLAVGDVEFNATAREAGARGAAAGDVWRGLPSGALLEFPFSPLNGTAAEIDAVVALFREAHEEGAAPLTRLEGDAAHEAAVRDALPRHAFAHLATHGFFVGPDEAPSVGWDAGAEAGGDARGGRATGGGSTGGGSTGGGSTGGGSTWGLGWPEPGAGWAGPHPGLYSGLVLAGANERGGADGPDGLLCALELATLDLSRVELLTLSACETGLGTASGGEGLLGMLRAAHVAGAGAVLASLWRVEDDATARWITSFYERVWGRGESFGEALRGVQLESIARRAPTRVWAAWVLSGR